MDPATQSNTSVCLKIVDKDVAALDAAGQDAFAKGMVALLEKQGVAHDIGAYRDAPVRFPYLGRCDDRDRRTSRR